MVHIEDDMEPDEDFRKIVPEGLVPLSDIDIKRLAMIFDESDVYLSIYLPFEASEHVKHLEGYINARHRAIMKALPDTLHESFNGTWDIVEDHIFMAPMEGERGRVIFASSDHDFLHVYHLKVEPERKFVLDTSPYLLPLAELMEEYMDYAIVMLDSREAHLILVKSDICHELEHESIDLMNKHRKGGMSQMRFHRLRSGQIDSFLEGVVEDMMRMRELHGLRGLIIAGPGEAKKHFIEKLPRELSEMVIGTIDSQVNMSCGELVEAGDEVAGVEERVEEGEHVELFRSHLMKDGLAVYGVQEIHEALIQGRVGELLILEDLSIPGWICERCQNLKEKVKPPERCPRCGGPTSEADIVEELYELAVRIDAHVEFVKEDQFLGSIGGLGALLRY
jgi:peptide chain release factor subunit 1